jgi:hypothetical protein
VLGQRPDALIDHVDNGTFGTRRQDARESLDQYEGRAEVGVHMGVPRGAGHVMPLVAVETAGVIDEHSNGTQLFRRLRDQTLYLCLVGQIRLEENCSSTQGVDFRQGLFRLVLAAVEMNGKIEPLLPERENDRSAQAVGATGHKGCFRDFGGYSGHQGSRR